MFDRALTTRSPRAGASALVAVLSIVLGSASTTLADQDGQARLPGINTRVGGVRAGLPGPSIGRRGSLLNRPSPILPPTPPAARPVIDRPTSTAGGGIVPRRFDSPSGYDKPCYVPRNNSSFNDGPVIGGSTVDGSTASDRFRLRFHIGSGFNNRCRPSHNVCWRWPITWYGYGNYWYDRPSVVYSGPWNGTDPFVTAGQNNSNTAQTPPRELTSIEKADLFWQQGQLDQSAAQFKDYFRSAPDDTDGMRYLAVLLIDQKKLDEAAAMLAMSYQKTPQLASRPLPGAEIPGGLKQMRARVNAMSAHANRVKTGTAWLALAVLIQSEGREDVTKTLIDRAAAAGLDEKVVAEFQTALK